MKAIIVSNKGKINVEDANVVLLPDKSLVLCYPIPNANGSADYHIADLVINDGCFFETKSSLTYRELTELMLTEDCKKIRFDEMTVFLLNDVIKKGYAYNEYIKFIKDEIANNRKKINALNFDDAPYQRVVATAHEDNGDLVLILYKYASDTIEQIQFKNEDRDNFLFLKDVKRVHTIRLQNTTLLKYAADLVSNREAGNLEIVYDKDNNEYCIEYLVINYVVQKVTFIDDDSKSRNILADDYIYVSKMDKSRKLRYKYHYKKDKSLFLGFHANIRVDNHNDDLVFLNTNTLYNKVND